MFCVLFCMVTLMCLVAPKMCVSYHMLIIPSLTKVELLKVLGGKVVQFSKPVIRKKDICGIFTHKLTFMRSWNLDFLEFRFAGPLFSTISLSLSQAASSPTEHQG